MRNYPALDNPVVNAYRKVWLAGLGAAVVTRDWAQAEAPAVFRNLVKEGTIVESRTIRIVGDSIEGTFSRANTLYRRAANLVQSNLPNVKLPAMFAPAAAKAKPAKKRATKAVKRVTRRKSRTAK